MAQKLVVCLDGTWNTESSFTNVWRIAVALNQGGTQRIYYDHGVGTKATDFVSGGAFGRGLSRNVLRAYQWLTQHYRLGDEIFIFGFSRGAFTARSLIGFLSVCGLLRPDAAVSIDAAFEMYRQKGIGRSSESAIEFRHRHSQEPIHGRPPYVKFVGVFDTVGALGIPVAQVPLFEDYRWHKVHLSEIVHHAYHALAIDEHRHLFQAAVWKNVHAHQTLEQVWFVGAHANVGGGYMNDHLSIRPLEWMQEKAKKHGLQFDYDPCKIRSKRDFYSARVMDSYREFLNGAYAGARVVMHPLSSRFYRPIGSPSNWHPERLLPGRQSTDEQSVGESLDYTVMHRVRIDRSYRPKNLANFFSISDWNK